MKQFFKMFFASLLAIVVSAVILCVLFFAVVGMIAHSVTSQKKTEMQTGSVLELDLNKAYHEQGQSNSFAAFSDDPSYEPGLYDVTEAIAHAKADNNIKGVFIKLSPSPNGWATMQQLRVALADFKTSGKFIYAYGEDISQGAYYLASVADSVYLNPVGGIEIKGFATVMPFFKGTLDRLEVQPEIYYAGKFKSATEPFRADKMSEPNKLQITTYQQSFWRQFAMAVAEHAHTDTNTINQLAQTGAIQFPNDALKNKIVDGLLYWDQVEDRIRAKTGLKDTEAVKYVSMEHYASDVRADRKMNDQRIAVLIAEGDIVDGGQAQDVQIASKDMVENIRKLAKNDHIKAVVLRVNSPGGSALASEVILRELELLKKKKPLIVSMGDYAASGGYYISSQADSIFAMPNTITGSIGVFSMMFNVEKLMNNKLGVTFDEVKTAPYADFPSGTRALTADEAQRMQNSVDTIYGIFKGHVATGRRLKPADVDSIAQGRVWTGSDALKIGLVDAMGNLNRAIQSAAAMAKIKDYEVVTYPEPQDKLESLLRRFKGNVAAAAMSASLKQELGADYQWYEKIKELRNMNGRAMMAMPFVYTVQ